jgi:hypothetical protein
MSKTNTKHIDRRALLKGVSIATAAAAIPTTIAAAIGTAPALANAADADPILAMIAEHHRVKALAEAATERSRAIADAWNHDLSGCGWPEIDFTVPELKDMREWLERRWERSGTAARNRVARHDVLAFNAELEVWGATREPDLLEQSRKDNATRLAWIDQLIAERERNAEISGFKCATDESEALWGEASELLSEALGTTATTVAGAWARLALAAATLRTDHTLDGELTGDMDIGGVLGAVADLERLGAMPGSAVTA